MKKVTLFSVLALASASALAQQAMVSEEWARVKRTEPIYGQGAAIQRNQCRTEMVTRQVQPAAGPRETNVGGAIVGTIIGGVLGHQVGGGRGKDVATAVGAGAGAILGERNIGASPNTPLYGSSETVPVERCEMVTEMQPAPLVGYRVILEYNGRDFVYQSPQAPREEYVKVRVSLTPVF